MGEGRDAFWFILHRPASPENLGLCARALKATGLGRLVLVDPPHHRFAEARKTAVRAEDLLDSMRVELTFEDAIAGAVRVVATTARPQESREALDPRACAEALVRDAERGPVALVFGEEKRGLPNRLLARCDAIATIPTDSAQPSLNLAQAVTIFAYELRRARKSRMSPFSPSRVKRGHSAFSRAATREDLTRLRALARKVLLEAGFLNPQQPDVILDEMCRLLARGGPTAREVGLYLAALKKLAPRG